MTRLDVGASVIFRCFRLTNRLDSLSAASQTVKNTSYFVGLILTLCFDSNFIKQLKMPKGDIFKSCSV